MNKPITVGSRVWYTKAHLQHMKWMTEQDVGVVTEFLPMSDRLLCRVLWETSHTTWTNIACLEHYIPEPTE